MKEATTVQRAHAYGTSPDCFEQCPGGNQCICNYRRHTLHICASETCYCHTRQRYEACPTCHQPTTASVATKGGHK